MGFSIYMLLHNETFRKITSQKHAYIVLLQSDNYKSSSLDAEKV